ncbi:MAG: response regulator [Dehalococcoidia bacterium]
MERRWKVMVAEDSENVVSVLHAALAKSGKYHVVTARNGEEALALSLQESPDVAVLDIMMPKVHGLKVCKSIKEDPRTANTCIVMLSALGTEYTKQEAYRYGADAFITKPFSPRELVNTIEILLRDRFAAPRGPKAVDETLGGVIRTFSRGDRVLVISGPDDREVLGTVQGRVQFTNLTEGDWGYRVQFDSGMVSEVHWDQVLPANAALGRAA